MSNSVKIKAALVVLLIAAGLIGHQSSSVYAPSQTSLWYDSTANWLLVGLALFGILNVVVSTPGTLWVRAIAIAVTLAALARPDRFLGLALPLAVWVWPPAFTIAFGAAGGSRATRAQEDISVANRARIAVAALVGAVALASLAYQGLVAHGLQQTAALFVGLPALLAIVVIFSVTPRTATGVACKAVTVGLLVSMLFLGEGILCVVMSAPLFYAIAVAIASSIDLIHRRREKATLFSCLLVLALVPMSLEGVTDFTTFDREESVAASKIVHGSPQAVERALFEPPRFDRARPLYLRAGFPSPVSTRIDRGLDPVRWVIQLRGGEMRLNGMEARTGDLILELEEARAGLVRWRAVSDSSHVTHFLTWREVIVQWEPVDASTTKVTWTLRYRRGLDPSWYFGPMERYAAGLAAGYLIDAVATP